MESAVFLARATKFRSKVRQTCDVFKPTSNAKSYLFHHQFAKFVRPSTIGKAFTSGSFLFTHPGCKGTRARLSISPLMVLLVFCISCDVCVFRFAHMLLENMALNHSVSVGNLQSCQPRIN